MSKIPDNIKVTATYSDELGTLTKDDIQLYVDMTEKKDEDTKYTIKYKSKYNFKNVKIDPQTVEI